MVMRAANTLDQDSIDINQIPNSEGDKHLLVAPRLVRTIEWLQLHRGPDYDRRMLFVERVAAIIGKTYVVCGDAADLADDVALMLIRDLLLELDGQVPRRNKRVRKARARHLSAKRK
jgi:hypothetical protein